VFFFFFFRVEYLQKTKRSPSFLSEKDSDKQSRKDD